MKLILLFIFVASTQWNIVVSDEICFKRPEICYVDKWGYMTDWTNLNDGWDDDKRASMIALEDQMKYQAKIVPQLTDEGFEKMKIPREVYDFILAKRRVHERHVEQCKNTAHQNCYTLNQVPGELIPKNNTKIMNVKDAELFKEILYLNLKPIVEKWSGIELKPTATYGIRRYLNGSRLSLHVDRLNTHLVGIILQIDQKVNKDWPLLLIDHQGIKHKIYLKPGEMLLFESAKLPHGRQIPLDGNFFDNLFVHFKPKKDWYPEEYATNYVMPNKIITKEDLI